MATNDNQPTKPEQPAPQADPDYYTPILLSGPSERENIQPAGGLKRRAEPKAEGDGETQPHEPAKDYVIRKGVYLSALIYVEGDEPLPADFNALATGTLERALTTFLSGTHGDLTMTLKRIDVENDVEEDDGEDKGKGDSAARKPAEGTEMSPAKHVAMRSQKKRKVDEERFQF